MGKYSDYVLISDMDGTLLNSRREVSRENREALRRFTEEGGNFCVATGRTPEDTRRFLQGIEINTSCVFFNGAMLYDYRQDKITKAVTLQGQKWRDFAAFVVENFPDLCTQVFTAEVCYVVSRINLEDPLWERATYEHIFCPLSEVTDKEWLKIMVHGDLALIRQMVAEAKKMGMDEISNSFFAADVCYEFVDKEASKGHMLKYLRQLPENRGRKVIAQGDYGNDTFMLQMADIGVASGNAHEDTKAAADIVGVTCDEHLAAYVVGLIDKGEI
ncbi:HAD-IIB family hydrolase [Anaerovibrio sp.]|uniref:HAD-IIB family hydrolase n=1 Tax=Anaerovibrio sp. TaxID=1872532 RepID=UPI002617DAAE|nr:HAD family hydrolase [Anaerovibrio sp.]